MEPSIPSYIIHFNLRIGMQNFGGDEHGNGRATRIKKVRKLNPSTSLHYVKIIITLHGYFKEGRFCSALLVT